MLILLNHDNLKAPIKGMKSETQIFGSKTIFSDEELE